MGRRIALLAAVLPRCGAPAGRPSYTLRQPAMRATPRASSRRSRAARLLQRRLRLRHRRQADPVSLASMRVSVQQTRTASTLADTIDGTTISHATAKGVFIVVTVRVANETHQPQLFDTTRRPSFRSKTTSTRSAPPATSYLNVPIVPGLLGRAACARDFNFVAAHAWMRAHALGARRQIGGWVARDALAGIKSAGASSAARARSRT
jgi:hypothetical protein